MFLIVFAVSAHGFDAKLLLPFNGGTNGQTVDAAYLNTNSIGTLPGNWSLTGNAGVIDTNFSLPLFMPAHINGTNYFCEGGHVIRISAGSEQSYRIEFPSGQRTNAAVIGLWMKNTTDGDGNKDVVSIVAGAGDSATLQLNDGTYITHTDFGGGAGAAIDIDHTVWHFFTYTFRMHGGNMDLHIYDTNGVLKGTSEFPITSDSTGITSFNWGNVNPHGDFPSGDLYFGPIVFWWGSSNSVKFPIGVPNYTYVSTSSGIDGAWDNATNADPVIVLSNGVYTAAISPSRSGTPGSPIRIKALNAGMVTNEAPITINGQSNIVFVDIIHRGDGSGGTDRGITFDEARGIELWHNGFTNFADFAIYSDPGEFGNQCISIGGKFWGNHTIGDGFVVVLGTNNLFGHFWMDKANQDYILYNGRTNIIRNGFAQDPDSNSDAHVDFFQSGSSLGTIPNNTYNTIERHFYRDSTTAGDDHHISNDSNTDDTDPYNNLLYRWIVSWNLGTVAHSIFENAGSGGAEWQQVAVIQSTYVRANRHPSNNGENTAVSISTGGAVKNMIIQDGWGVNVNDPDVWSGTGIIVDGNLYYDSTETITLTGAAAGDANEVLNQDPLFSGFSSQNFRLQSGSPARNVGVALTTVASAGASGTTFKVRDARYFRGDNPALSQYNGNLVQGDTITVGTDVVQILSIDGTNITTTTSFTWATNDNVYLGGSATPDIGAYPFSHTPLSSITAITNGQTVTYSVTGDYMFVVIFVDGVPFKVCYVGQPLTLERPSSAMSNVTARAYSLYAHDGEPWVSLEAPAQASTHYRNKGKARAGFSPVF